MRQEISGPLRIIGLIVFNMGMGSLIESEIPRYVFFLVAFFGNLGIIFLTRGNDEDES